MRSKDLATPDLTASAAKSLALGPLIALIAALQCVYVLDFMLVLPLGPDLAAALGFQSHQVAWLTLAYTLASLLGGLFAVPHLDRFDRRSALVLSLSGLSLAILACIAAEDLASLLVARAAAGLCGAPAIATGMAILIDHTPPAQRGAAMAKVMLGFSLASIAGIPVALELSARLGWQAPFVLLATLVALVALAAAYGLPALRAHLQGQQGQTSRSSLRSLLARPVVRSASWLQGLNQFAAFLVIPNFSAFYLLNLDFPRAHLAWLYLAGGICALLAMRLAGYVNDRRGPWLPALLASISFVLGLLPFFGVFWLPISLCFVLFMAGNAARSLCLSATLSHIPAPPERAGFMALQKMVQDLSVALAAGVAALLLANNEGGPLTHTAELAALSIAGALGVLLLLKALRQRLAAG